MRGNTSEDMLSRMLKHCSKCKCNNFLCNLYKKYLSFDIHNITKSILNKLKDYLESFGNIILGMIEHIALIVNTSYQYKLYIFLNLYNFYKVVDRTSIFRWFKNMYQDKFSGIEDIMQFPNKKKYKETYIECNCC